jgi:3',5'-cyclic AMP phosphodiesterase CpdA
MDLRRREFLKLAGLGLAAASLDPRRLLPFSSGQDPATSPLWPQLADDSFPFPYDENFFACAERIYNLRPNRGQDRSFLWRANLNLILKEGTGLDIKVVTAPTREALATSSAVQPFIGVKDSLTVPLTGNDSERLYYQVLYRSGQEAWRALSPKSFRLPNTRLEDGGRVKVLVIADDHNFDDADHKMPPSFQGLMLSGDYVNEFLKALRFNASWQPSPPLDTLDNGFSLAQAMQYILTAEDPDFLINLGDTTGLGASYRWAALGLPSGSLTEEDKETVARTLWLRMRKIFSALTPSLPIFQTLGNHDGEESWNSVRDRARSWRQKYFTQPTNQTYPEGGHSQGNYYAFTWGGDVKGRGGAEFIILDCTAFCGGREPVQIQEWTLGAQQFDWLKNVLQNREKHWIFACVHHALGGWPAGPEETRLDLAYGRGPLFLRQDYQNFGDPAGVEQVRITDLAAEAGLTAFLYGHDHIRHHRQLMSGWNQRPLYSLCCGSPKRVAEEWWWDGAYWRRFYGEGYSQPPGFFGPPGYTRLTLEAHRLTADYVLVSYSPFSNVPSGTRAGDIFSRLVVDSPEPRIATDQPALAASFEEGQPGRLSLSLKVKNDGAGPMNFSLTPSQSWIELMPAAGKSWGEYEEVEAIIRTVDLVEGQYAEHLTINSPEAKNSPIQVPLTLTVLPPVIKPPTDLRGEWRRAQAGQYVALLAWTPNRANRHISCYNVYLAGAGGGPELLGAVSPSSCGYVYSAGGRRARLTFLVSAVNQHGREGEPAACTVE